MAEDKKKVMLDIEKLASTAKLKTPSLAELARSGKLPVSESAISAIQKLNSGVLADAKRHIESNSIQSVIAAAQKQIVHTNALSTAAKLGQLVEQNSALSVAMESVTRQEALMAASSSFLKSTRISEEWTRQFSAYKELDRLQANMFSLPKLSEATRLFEASRLGAVSSFLKRHERELLAQQTIVTSMDIPWLRNLKEAQSATCFCELHSIGTALKSFPGFDPGLTAALRLDFGDWRDKITFPENVFVDASARVEFYVDRGFNQSLTDFPDAAFSQGLELAGLHGGILFDEADWMEIAPSDDPVEEAAYQRTNRCHNYLQRLERKLRLFIDKVMTAQYGPDWPKKQLPRDLLENWESKKSKAEAYGTSLSLFIEVADFTDYEKIICQKKHWQEVFQPWFRRQESVRESFQRLYPIRLATMHARFVTKEDELYVVAETTRLLSAI